MAIRRQVALALQQITDFLAPDGVEIYVFQEVAESPRPPLWSEWIAEPSYTDLGQFLNYTLLWVECKRNIRTTLLPNSQHFDWREVHYRVTLAWDHCGVLAYERFELAGPNMIGPRTTRISEDPSFTGDVAHLKYGCSIFLGAPTAVVKTSNRHERTLGLEQGDIEGTSIPSSIKNPDLNHIASRTGLERARLDQAM